ncbi:MAG: SET domain-containing protein-lysine N-methyltransferase [Verrucomicrobia bacterium]|nr:SET domain-containing protein-lysine N-methyltransferase [Verrucomicrobiota bacterium]
MSQFRPVTSRAFDSKFPDYREDRGSLKSGRKTKQDPFQLSETKKGSRNVNSSLSRTSEIDRLAKKRSANKMEEGVEDEPNYSSDDEFAEDSSSKLRAIEKGDIPGVPQKVRPQRERKPSAILNPRLYEVPTLHRPKFLPENDSVRMEESGSEELPLDPVYQEKFGIETTVRYTTQHSVAPECKGTLQKCWRAYKKEYSMPKTAQGKKEVAAFRDCIQNSSPDGHDKWTDKYEVKKVSDVVGHGLFATKDYKKGEVIGHYAGRIVPTKSIEDDSYAFEMFANPFEGHSIEGAEESNATRYINHAPLKYTNVDTVEFFDKGLPYVIFTARCAIKAGEELLYDYGQGYWEKKGIEPVFLPKNA